MSFSLSTYQKYVISIAAVFLSAMVCTTYVFLKSKNIVDNHRNIMTVAAKNLSESISYPVKVGELRAVHAKVSLFAQLNPNASFEVISDELDLLIKIQGRNYIRKHQRQIVGSPIFYNDIKVGRVIINSNLPPFNFSLFDLLFCSLLTIVILGVFFYCFQLLQNKTQDLEILVENLNNIDENNYSSASSTKIKDHFIAGLSVKIQELFSEKVGAIKALSQVKLDQLIVDQAKQVAHDIKSPLAALNVLKDEMKTADQNQIELLSMAITRIDRISSNLLKKNEVTDKEQVPFTLLIEAVNEIVSEKKMEYKNEKLKFIVNVDPNAAMQYTKLPKIQLTRILSNLINNSIEAMNYCGDICISIRLNKNSPVLLIKDNGPGMSEKVLEKIGRKGYSSGKVHLQGSGSGLGVFSAQKTLTENNCSLSFESQIGKGTIASIGFPENIEYGVLFPAYYSLLNSKQFLVYDDDINLKKLWERVFPDSRKILYARNRMELEKLIANVRASDSICILSDYNLGEGCSKGNETIKQLGLTEKTIIVTSDYNSLDLIDFALNHKVSILPKQVLHILNFAIYTKRNQIFLQEPTENSLTY